MNIFIERKQKTIRISDKNITVEVLLKKLKLRTSEVLVVRNNLLVTEDALLEKQDTVHILSVISGG